MCGRFTLTVPDAEDVAEALGAFLPPEIAAAYRPRFNIAPTDGHLVARVKDGRRELAAATWGFLPHWAKDAKEAAKAINARSESVRSKPTFRDACARGRCLVPADGFYEWTGEKKARRPIWYHPPGGGVVTFAGLYGAWTNPATGARERTFTILTTAANDVVSPVHDRMPALIAPDDAATWLGADADAAFALLHPAPDTALEPKPVSRRVNAVANDDPSLLEPDPEDAGATGAQATLPLFGRS
ncbi:MAG TPA: SOS response-associated peptidase [Minicystis sp.]|nr:SOS response-associated peptidase [Minicystis sp.]